MPSHRIDRAAQDIKRELSAVIRELKDPRISGIISVVRLELSGDMSYATVYISSSEGMTGAKNAVAGLKSAAGFIKREIGHSVKIRKMPEFRFIADDSIEQGAILSRRISGMNIPPAEDEDEQEI